MYSWVGKAFPVLRLIRRTKLNTKTGYILKLNWILVGFWFAGLVQVLKTFLVELNEPILAL